MNENDLNTAKLLQIKILKYFHEFCLKNDLKYFLTYGSLLGSIRHEGFIPWDDDIDVGMTRENYDKFIQLCKTELDDEYFFQTVDTDDGYGWFFGKLMLKDTLWIENNSLNTNKKSGIYIDIFPYDLIPNNKIIHNFLKIKYRIIQGSYLLKKKYNIYNRDKKSFIYDLYNFFLKIFSKVFSSKFLKSKLVNIHKFNKTKNSVFVSFENCIITSCLPKNFFDYLCLHKFENLEAFIPENYDVYLKQIYGDYMVLPPIDKQVPHHDVIYYNFTKG